ncbi:MAG: hypothetical protein GY696_20090 [Gammaproteobacteria bacterium]|nr:hypothetical protein [Gammaproteobacteria bacterium]
MGRRECFPHCPNGGTRRFTAENYITWKWAPRFWKEPPLETGTRSKIEEVDGELKEITES